MSRKWPSVMSAWPVIPLRCVLSDTDEASVAERAGMKRPGAATGRAAPSQLVGSRLNVDQARDNLQRMCRVVRRPGPIAVRKGRRTRAPDRVKEGDAQEAVQVACRVVRRSRKLGSEQDRRGPRQALGEAAPGASRVLQIAGRRRTRPDQAEGGVGRPCRATTYMSGGSSLGIAGFGR
jgi:hypothetical protein